jgi:hypothetical protein
VSLLDLAMARRAAEQVAAVAFDHRWERDSCAIVGSETQLQRAPRRPCLAGDCRARVVAMGYCRNHAQKIRDGVALDRDLITRRRTA